jgi:uncharacterized membrane protein (UPF0136 family)
MMRLKMPGKGGTAPWSLVISSRTPGESAFIVVAMVELAKIFYFVFGALTIVGGVMGYVKASSSASLIAGSISGILLIVAGVLAGSGKVQAALILGAIISIALAARFVPAYFATHKMMPAGMMAILSVIGIIVTALAFFKK